MHRIMLPGARPSPAFGQACPPALPAGTWAAPFISAGDSLSADKQEGGMRMLFAGILWRLAVIVFAANAVILLADLIPACGAGIPFTGKTAGFCRRARKAALIALRGDDGCAFALSDDLLAYGFDGDWLMITLHCRPGQAAKARRLCPQGHLPPRAQSPGMCQHSRLVSAARPGSPARLHQRADDGG